MFSKIISSPLVKSSIRYGAIAGVLCMVFLITFYFMGKSPFLVDPYLDFRVLLFSILIFFCLKEVRDFYQGGILFMWQGMTGGLIFLSAAGIVAAVGILIFGALQPALLTDYISEFGAQIRSYPDDIVKKIGKDVLERNLNALSSTNMGNVAWMYVKQTFIIGLFITVIISVILRRQPKPE